jgi:hypothetical protein
VHATSADGRTIVSGSADDIVRIWDATTGECLEVRRGTNHVAAIAASNIQDHFNVHVRGIETVIEQAATGQKVAWYPAAPLANPNSERLVVSSPTGNAWAIAVGKNLQLFTVEGSLSARLIS